MKFKKTKKEVWLGTLRCNVDEETATFFNDQRIVAIRKMGDGQVFLKYGDGHIEPTTEYELAMKKIKEMNERK